MNKQAFTKHIQRSQDKPLLKPTIWGYNLTKFPTKGVGVFLVCLT